MITAIVVELKVPVVAHALPPQPVNGIKKIIVRDGHRSAVARHEHRHPTQIQPTVVVAEQQRGRTGNLLTKRSNFDAIPIDHGGELTVSPNQIEMLKIPMRPTKRPSRHITRRSQVLVLSQQNSPLTQKLDNGPIERRIQTLTTDMRQEAIRVLHRAPRISHTCPRPHRGMRQVRSAEHVQAFVKPTQTYAQCTSLFTAELETTGLATRNPRNHTIGVTSNFQDIVTSPCLRRQANWEVQLGQLSHHAQIAARGIDANITNPLQRVAPRSCPHLPILIHQSSSEKIHLEDRPKTEAVTNSPKIIHKQVITGGERKIR